MDIRFSKEDHKSVYESVRADERLNVVYSESDTELLIQGDNLSALKHLIEAKNLRKKVNLVYIDPPFSTNTSFRVNTDGRTSTISSSKQDKIAYSDHLSGDEYINFIRQRLILLKEVMAEDASIYLHIDYKIGHYLKVLMDEVFGIGAFRSDIARIKCNPKNFKRKAYGNIKDMILFYATGDYTWNDPRVPFTRKDLDRLFPKTDINGERYTTNPLHAPGETVSGKTGGKWRGMLPPPGRHWRYAPEELDRLDMAGLIEWSNKGVPRKKIYAKDRSRIGKRAQDIWEFKDPQYPSYPTEKNQSLLELIVRTSSNPGDIVLDCFAGSGTTLVAAKALGRKWIGIDSAESAVQIAKQKLMETETSSPKLF